MKSHYCGEITSSNLKEKVTICGWIHRRRDHGGVIFLDVRDIKGICQAVVNPDNKESFQLAESIRNEFVVQIEGVVRNRLEGTINKNMQTGEIEIEVANINIHTTIKPMILSNHRPRFQSLIILPCEFHSS